MASSQQQLSFAIKAINEASKTLKEIENDTQSLTSKVTDSSTKFAMFGGAMVAATAGAAALALTVGPLKDAVTAASDLGESMNAVNVVFKEQSDTILDWGKNNATAYGLSQRAFNQMATPMGAILSNLGFSQKETADQTVNLTKRAADMASVFNTTVPDALDAINSALRGEGNPIERYGVSVNQTAVNLRALADTGKNTAADLTETEKAAARLALIFEQTAKVEGDFANTSDGLANSQRIAAARLEEVQATVGEKLIPVFKAWSDLQVRLADALLAALPTIIMIVEHVGALGQAIANNQPLLIGIAAAIGAMLVPALVALTIAAGTAAVAFVVAAAPLVAIGLAVGALTFAIIWLWQNWDEAGRKIMEFTASFSETVMGYINSIVDGIMERWPLLGGVLGPVIEGAGIIIMTVFRSIMDIVAILIAVIKGDFTGAWRGLGTLVSDVFDGMISAIRSAVNVIIGLFNVLISAWNSLGFDIDTPFGGSIHIGTPDIPNIPQLAEGGIVTRPTLAWLGEAGTEAIIPLDRFAQGGGGGGNGGGNTYQVIVLSPDAVLSTIVDLERSGRLAAGVTSA